MTRLWQAILADPKTWAIIGAAFIVTLGAIGYTLVIMLASWPDELAETRLNFMGWALFACLLNITAIIAALTKRRVSAHGPGGISFETGSETEPPAVTTTTTTTVPVTPVAPKEDPNK